MPKDTEQMRGIDEIIGEIEKNLEVEAISQISIEKMNPKLFEELGDSVMKEVLGNHSRHEWMDKMMGGDGSEQLVAFHRSLGY